MPHRILVVEDSPELLLIFVRTLANAGFEVMAASSNSEAMMVLQKFAPDLVLIDCLLAGAGPLAVSVLKQSRPALPVVVLSEDREAARKLLPEADAVLCKPISIAELVQTVFHCIGAAEVDRLSSGR